MNESRRKGYPHPQVFGGRRNNWHDGLGRMNGTLHRPFHALVGTAAHVAMRRQFIGDKHAIEKSTLHGPAHVLPIGGTKTVPVDFVLDVPAVSYPGSGLNLLAAR